MGRTGTHIGYGTRDGFGHWRCSMAAPQSVCGCVKCILAVFHFVPVINWIRLDLGSLNFLFIHLSKTTVQ